MRRLNTQIAYTCRPLYIGHIHLGLRPLFVHACHMHSLYIYICMQTNDVQNKILASEIMIYNLAPRCIKYIQMHNILLHML